MSNDRANAEAHDYTPEEARAAVVAILAESPTVTMRVTFVPFEHSRNRAEQHPSLNYQVAILSDGRPVLDTDYMMGSGYCPANKLTAKQLDPHVGKENSYTARLRREAIAHECATGREVRLIRTMNSNPTGVSRGAGRAILPELADVIFSLAMDASALDFDTFVDWADDYGYSSDSIKARETYEACREHGAKLRRAVGADRFERLRAAASQM
ncbi:hypothetical protein [Lysobacter capsici]|uniref:hypothetical protein n=1 Tax=Lysobacter capsici TaxID=435897 RepID=UPI001C0047B5|nr:hypothetical protein [Lysobacter capsici]QWF18685.1 hypothetical protein KME82_08070 [Lysobacter capsici]